MLGAVKKKKKTTYSKLVPIKGVAYNDSTPTVTINLARPFKGTVQVTIHGGVLASNGAASSGDVSKIVP